MSSDKTAIRISFEAFKRTKQIFPISTDKEAVKLALELDYSEKKIIRTHKKLAGQLKLQESFR